MGLLGYTKADVDKAYKDGRQKGRREVWERWLTTLFRDPSIPFDAPNDIVEKVRKEAEARKRARGVG